MQNMMFVNVMQAGSLLYTHMEQTYTVSQDLFWRASKRPVLYV